MQNDFAKIYTAMSPLLATASTFITSTCSLTVHTRAVRCFPLFKSSPDIDNWWKLTAAKMKRERIKLAAAPKSTSSY